MAIFLIAVKARDIAFAIRYAVMLQFVLTNGCIEKVNISLRYKNWTSVEEQLYRIHPSFNFWWAACRKLFMPDYLAWLEYVLLIHIHIAKSNSYMTTIWYKRSYLTLYFSRYSIYKTMSNYIIIHLLYQHFFIYQTFLLTSLWWTWTWNDKKFNPPFSPLPPPPRLRFVFQSGNWKLLREWSFWKIEESKRGRTLYLQRGGAGL